MKKCKNLAACSRQNIFFRGACFYKQGFYDRDKLFWKEIADTMLITGAAPPGGGRSEVTPRFVRHFNVFCVPQASNSAMSLIFSSMLKVRMQ